MDLLAQFEAFIQTNALIQPDERVLVAVSGGVDSVVLADLFRRSGRAFGVAHCNFRLRGEESDADEAFVRTLADQWGAPLFVQHFDTRKFATENGLSTQMAARALRYRWFEVVCAAEDFAAIATGHQLNDSVETTLLHFIRGTGLTGLCGIPLRNDRLIRPLLFASRDEVEAYARERGLAWRDDSSNATDDYTRNAIRHRVVPQLEAINPAFLSSAAATIRHLRGADANLQFLLGKLLGEADANGVYRIDKTLLAALPALRDALFDLLQPFGFQAGQVEQMVAAWEHAGLEWQTASGFRLINDRDAFLLTKNTAVETSIKIGPADLMVTTPDGWRLVITPAEAGSAFPDAREAVLVDAEKLRFPLHLRRWKPGDLFQPLGMGGQSQKLQDFFTNHKLSRLDKERSWILEDAGQRIVWITGERLDERFKVANDTIKLLKLSWIKQL